MTDAFERSLSTSPTSGADGQPGPDHPPVPGEPVPPTPPVPTPTPPSPGPTVPEPPTPPSQPPPEASDVTQPPYTGDAQVDRTLEELVDVTSRPLDEQVELYVGVHRRLQDRLADLDG
jgi:hypothetical protein